MSREAQTALLARAADGDTEAFLDFYDATSSCAYTLALARARSQGLRGDLAASVATRETEIRYAAAWQRCAEHADSGLSPMAWLLTVPLSKDDREDAMDVVACA